uniref:FACT complex subunit n=1 Tax=Aureoumbra lagunensis TaxID=44058 RepID=A0A7S3JR27_9STRA
MSEEKASVSAEILRSRCASLAKSLNDNDLWNGAEALVVTHGEAQYGSFNRGAALSMHLLGSELKGGAIVVTKEKVLFVISQKVDEEGVRAAQGVKSTNDGIEIDFEALDTQEPESLPPSTEIKNLFMNKNKVGAVAKLELWDRWKAMIDPEKLVDVTAGIAKILYIKDTAALKRTNWAASMAIRVFKSGILRAIEKALDEDEVITHEALAEKAEALCTTDPARIKAKDIPSDAHLESCYFPIIQSGGEYDVKPSAMSNANRLKDDVIILSLGVRCEGYCANVSRTLFIDPIPKLRQAYAALLAAREASLKAMRIDQPLSEARAAAEKVLAKHQLDMYLPKNIGFGLGLDFRDASAILNAKNTKTFQADTLFSLSLAIHDMPLPKSETEHAKGSIASLKKVSLLLADTVRIRADTAIILTNPKIAPIDWREVSYFINEDEEEDDDDNVSETEKMDIDESNIKRTRTRGAAQEQFAQQNLSSVKERQVKQAALMEAALAERRRVQQLKNSQHNNDENDDDKIVEVRGAYPSTLHYPEELSANEVCVDTHKEVIFCPINGVPVPIHISWIKTCVQPEADRAAAYLRLNLYAPGQSLGKDVPPSTAAVIEAFGKQQFFVKELLFRSREQRRLNAAYRAIQTLRKTYRQRLTAKAQQQDLVQQATLIKARDGRAPRIADLSMRPVASGKKKYRYS